MSPKYCLLLIVACSATSQCFSASADTDKEPISDPVAGLSLKNLTPNTALHDDFINAPIFTAPAPFPGAPGFKTADTKESGASSSLTYLVTGLPLTDHSYRTGERPTMYRRTSPGPLLKVGYGDTIRVGPPLGKDGRGAIRVRPVALLGAAPRGTVLWGLDAEGKTMSQEEARKLWRSFTHSQWSYGINGRLAAAELMLVLRGEDTPVSAGIAYLRRDDTGDITPQGIHLAHPNPGAAATREFAIIIQHPYHDAPPVSLGFELFAGEPEAPQNRNAPAYSHARAESRMLKLGEAEQRFETGGGMSGDIRHFQNTQELRRIPEKLREPVTLAPDGSAVLGYAYAYSDESKTGKTVWYATNELTTKTRFVVANPPHPKTALLGDMSFPDGVVLGCADDGKGDAPAPARFPYSTRILMKLPELPGDWPNRGVSEPLDWKIRIPEGHGGKPYELSGLDFSTFALWDHKKGGTGVIFNRPVIVQTPDRTISVRDILRQVYAQELRAGVPLKVDWANKRIEPGEAAQAKRD